jgi:hypothetical protein
MLLQDAQANGVRGMDNGAIRHRATNRRNQRDDGSDVFGPLPCNRARDHASQAVADQVNFAAGLVQRSFYRRAYVALDQEVGAVGVDADAGKIRAVADAFQPAVEFRQIKIGAEKTGMITTPELSPRGTPKP